MCKKEESQLPQGFKLAAGGLEGVGKRGDAWSLNGHLSKIQPCKGSTALAHLDAQYERKKYIKEFMHFHYMINRTLT